jgi:hypothetical protein
MLGIQIAFNLTVKRKIGGSTMMNDYGIDMIKVNSSNVKEIGYDGINKTLYIEFLNNSLYIYNGVPINKFEGLKNAPSVGSYLNRNIKDSYSYRRIG